MPCLRSQVHYLPQSTLTVHTLHSSHNIPTLALSLHPLRLQVLALCTLHLCTIHSHHLHATSLRTPHIPFPNNLTSSTSSTLSLRHTHVGTPRSHSVALTNSPTQTSFLSPGHYSSHVVPLPRPGSPIPTLIHYPICTTYPDTAPLHPL